MKVILFGRNSKTIEPLVKSFGFKIVKKDPDFVISYGGDGTLMESEYEFPEIPKIILKGSLICKKASYFCNEDVLKKIKNKEFKIKEYFKLTAETKKGKLVAVNDIVIHNKDPRHAIRYKALIVGAKNEKEIGQDVIGDGVIVATPFGSTGYYRSITDSFFEVGIGLAFNNSTEQADHAVLAENKKVRIIINRGPAVMYADNQVEHIELGVGDEVVIRRSDKTMRLVFPI